MFDILIMFLRVCEDELYVQRPQDVHYDAGQRHQMSYLSIYLSSQVV